MFSGLATECRLVALGGLYGLLENRVENSI